MGGLATTYAVDTINSSATKLFKDVFKFIYFKNLVFQVTSLAFIASTKNVRVTNHLILIATKVKVVYP